MTDTKTAEERAREQLANQEHERWSRWMDYLFGLCEITPGGDIIIPLASVSHWKRQIGMTYDELSEKEKDSDRKEADNTLELLQPFLKSNAAEARREALREAIALIMTDIEEGQLRHSYQLAKAIEQLGDDNEHGIQVDNEHGIQVDNEHGIQVIRERLRKEANFMGDSFYEELWFEYAVELLAKIDFDAGRIKVLGSQVLQLRLVVEGMEEGK